MCRLPSGVRSERRAPHRRHPVAVVPRRLRHGGAGVRADRPDPLVLRRRRTAPVAPGHLHRVLLRVLADGSGLERVHHAAGTAVRERDRAMTLALAIPATPSVLPVELLRRFDVPGPRYTSYPTADRFADSFGAGDYAQVLH